MLLVACTRSEPTLFPTPTATRTPLVESYDDLVSLMRDSNLELTEIGGVQMPCLLVNPMAVLVHGTVEMANIAIGGISPNRFEDVLKDFESYLHYFKRNKLVVRYIGDELEVSAALESALGPQFADDTARINCY